MTSLNVAVCGVLSEQLKLTLPPTARQEDREALAQKQARAGVALLHLGRTERVWPLFHQGEDPTRRTLEKTSGEVQAALGDWA